MRDQVGRITLKRRRKGNQLAFAAGHPVATEERTRRAEAGSVSGLDRKAAVRLEQESAGICRAAAAAAGCGRRVRIGCDHAAEADRRRTNVADEIAVETASRAVRRAGSVRFDNQQRVVRVEIGTARSIKVRAARIFEVDRDVATAIGEVLARRQRDELVAGIAITRNAALPTELNAIKVVLEDEVHDARDRVRTINGRCAAGHDVDTLDQIRRNGVGVDRDAVRQHVRTDMTAAVDQHQRALRTETAKVEQVEAARSEEARRVLLAERAAQLRQFVE